MEFSVAGFVGAAIGVAVGTVNYAVIVGIVERRLRKLDRSQSRQERAEFERKLSLMRRIVLGMDIVVFSVVGYAVGRMIGD